MMKIILCTAALLCVAASIFGGYYFFANDDLDQATVQKSLEEMRPETLKATDDGVLFNQRSGALMDEDGEIDPMGIRYAIAQRDLYLAQHMPPDGFGHKGDGPLPQVPNNWLPRGPQNMGGRTEALLLHPNFGTLLPNRHTMWAGGASGGVWISDNAGKSWSAVNGILQNFHVSCFALDPEDTSDEGHPMTIYAGTGALNYHGGGVFKSTNGGMDWTRVPGTDGWKYVTGLAVTRDDNGDIVILAAMEGSDIASSPDRGIMRYRRLATGQEIWDPVIPALYGTSVGFDPNDPSIAVGAVCYGGDPDGDADGSCKAFYSDDYGLTWVGSSLGNTATPNPSPTPELFETARVEHPIFFFFQKLSSGGTTIYAQNGTGNGNTSVMSKSTNGGIYFSRHNMVGVPEGINEGVHPLWVSPELNSAGSNVVITGGAHHINLNL